MKSNSRKPSDQRRAAGDKRVGVKQLAHELGDIPVKKLRYMLRAICGAKRDHRQWVFTEDEAVGIRRDLQRMLGRGRP